MGLHAPQPHRPSRPVLNSEVFILNQSQHPAIPPSSPPTPGLSPPESVVAALDCADTDLSDGPSPPGCLEDCTHLLRTVAAAMQHLTTVYEQDASARAGFSRSVELVSRQKVDRSKLLVVGVGKSGHIGKKMVATFQSLGLRATFLHPTEALHGDLGFVDPQDVVLFVTSSGRTQELLLLLAHLPPTQPMIVLTCQANARSCEMLRQRPDAVHLPVPLLVPEKTSFGIAAPTTSTTISLALADALALAAAKATHPALAAVFAKNHPGGAIGVANKVPTSVGDLCTPWDDIPETSSLSLDSLGVDLLRAGFDCTGEWMRIGDVLVLRNRLRSLENCYLTTPLRDMPFLMASRQDMTPIPAHTSVQDGTDMFASLHPTTDTWTRSDQVIAVMGEVGNLHGIVSVGELLERHPTQSL